MSAIKYTEENILNYVVKNNRINPNYTNKDKLDRYYSECKILMDNMISTKYTWCYSYKELIFNLIKNIKIMPKCGCGNKRHFVNQQGMYYSDICNNNECKKSRSSFISSQRIQTEDEKIKRANSCRGKKRSEETKLKMSIAMKNSDKHNLSVIKRNNMSIEEKKLISEKQSNIMKEKIAMGEFTPCITNSWTHFTTVVNDKKFRSTFEGIFYIYKFLYLNNYSLQYEKLRIPYMLDNEKKIYIVDFIDETKKCVYEIKPQSLIENKKNLLKNDALLKWSIENKFSFYYINEYNIFDMYKEMKNNNYHHEFMNEFAKKYAKYL